MIIRWWSIVFFSSALALFSLILEQNGITTLRLFSITTLGNTTAVVTSNLATSDQTSISTVLLPAAQICNASNKYLVEDTDFASRHNLSEIISGESNSSICEIDPSFQNGHFPHEMQQLVRCYSYWQSLPGAQQRTLVSRSKRQSTFLQGFYQALQEACNVSIVDHSNESTVKPVVPGLGYEVRDPNDLSDLRDRIISRYRIDSIVCSQNGPVIGVLNRGKRRRWLNADNFIDRLKATNFKVQHRPNFNSATFLEQVSFMASIDILVSPHGAQLSSLGFMKPCSLVLELFPPGYFVPWFFGSLAAGSGVHHSVLYTGEDQAAEIQYWTANLIRKSQAKALPVCADIDQVVEWIKSAELLWQNCCRKLQNK